jgi:hypothetical protein
MDDLVDALEAVRAAVAEDHATVLARASALVEPAALRERLDAVLDRLAHADAEIAR